MTRETPEVSNRAELDLPSEQTGERALTSFLEPQYRGETLGFPAKAALSISVGLFYSLLLYISLPDKMAYFSQSSWIIGAMISTCMLAIYLAFEVLRSNLALINRFEANSQASANVMTKILSNRNYWLAGLGFGLINNVVIQTLGVPQGLQANLLVAAVSNLGYFMAGFTAGVGLWAIFGGISLYVRLAPELPYALDPDHPDRLGGFKKLSDALWFFSMLTAAFGLLSSSYMFNADWTNLQYDWVRRLYLFWISMPFLAAVSIVLIPGLAVRRHVSRFKLHREVQLKREQAQAYASYKQYADADDDAIIASKKELQQRMERIDEQIRKLRQMRNSHIDGGGPKE